MARNDKKKGTYLPLVEETHLADLLFSDTWSGIEALLSGADFERLGLDRFLRIATDIIDLHGSLEDLDILDVGCNTGAICHGLAVLGARVTGIDSGHVDGQGLYQNLEFATTRIEGLKFEVKDLLTSLLEPSFNFDVVLLLSVIHHWRTGYAQSGHTMYEEQQIAWIAETLMSRTRLSVYLELPIDEPGYEGQSGLELAEPFLAAAASCSELGLTVGPNGYVRRLLRLDTRNEGVSKGRNGAFHA